MSAAHLIPALHPLTHRVRTDVTAVKNSKGAQAWTREALTPHHLGKHLNGGPARGVCPIHEGQSVTMVALLDLDSHKGETPWPEMVAAAKAISEGLELCGFNVIPWRSSGGRGIHLYMVWDEPQDAFSVRDELRQVLSMLGYQNGTGGLVKGQVEIFPKQDSVPEGGFGNQFVLPLAGESVPLIDWAPGTREDALTIEWPASDTVAPRQRPERRPAATPGASGDLVRLQAALACIPNEGEQEQDYDTWRDIVFGIHDASEGSDEGLALAHEFSARSSKYDPEFLDNRVWPYIKSVAGGVTAQTIYMMARNHGFDAATADDFEPAPSVEVTEADGTVTVVEQPPPILLVRNRMGSPTPVPENLHAHLMRPDRLGYEVSFDGFLDQLSIRKPGGEWRGFRNTDYEVLRIRFGELGYSPVPGTEAVRTAVALAAARNSRDSAIEWGSSLVWDGVERIEMGMVTYFGAIDTPYARAVGMYLWTALAARCMEPGAKVDIVPVLVGAQGTRKTSGVTVLAPWQSAFAEVSLGSLDDNVSRRLRGRMVCEFGELRGLRTREGEHIKEWLSRTHEDFVPKYQEFAVSVPRRCVFIGTTNDTEILDDATGERRWAPLYTGLVDVDALVADRDQLWAEGIARWRTAGVAWRDAETLAKPEHAQFKVSDSWEGPIADWLRRDDMDGNEKPTRGERGVTVREVLVSAVGLNLQRITRSDEMRCARALTAMGAVKRRVQVAGNQAMRWYLHT